MRSVVGNLDWFIESINCIKDTYYYSERTLKDYLRTSTFDYQSFVNKCKKDVQGDRTSIIVPPQSIREFQRLLRRKNRAERAFELVPQSYLVSLVSVYDTFFSGLVRTYYDVCPQKLLEDETPFLYRDLQSFQSLSEVKKSIVNKRIEKLLRDSHIAQIDWFAKALGINTLSDGFKGWESFVEITERRNLFVHTGGVVSKQYLDICKKHNALDPKFLEGSTCSVDKRYFDKAFKTLYKMSIMLSQILLRVKYCEIGDSSCSSKIDKVLIENVYDLIVDELFDVAIDVSEMVLDNKKFSHNAFDRGYIVLNYAQACKWNGDKEKCMSILHKEDWSACTNELLLPKFTLEDNYAEAYRCMRELGKNNSSITISSYREWPIFQRLREEKEFKTVFEEVFGETISNSPVEVAQPSQKESTTVVDTSVANTNQFVN